MIRITPIVFLLAVAAAIVCGQTFPAAQSTLATRSGTETLTNKTFTLGNNTLTGTTAQFNAALTDGDFATLAGMETLTNKTINLASNTLTGTVSQFNAALSDGDFATLAGTETLTGKTLSLGSNTLTGTIAQFNAALSDGDFATLAGTETLTNKTLTSPTINGGALSGTFSGNPTFLGNVTFSGSGAQSFGGAVTISTTTNPQASLLTSNSFGPQLRFQNSATPTAANWLIGVPGSLNSTGYFIYDQSVGGFGPVVEFARGTGESQFNAKMKVTSTSLEHLRLGNRFGFIGSSNFHVTNNLYYDGSFKYATVGKAQRLSINSDGSLVYTDIVSGAADAAASFPVTQFSVDSSGNLSFSGILLSDTNNSWVSPSATAVRVLAQTSWGAVVGGYGTINDVSLFNRAGGLALSVPANTTNVAVSGTLLIADGSAASPSLVFAADNNTGLARAGTDQLEISAGGVRAGLFTPTGARALGTTTNDNAATGFAGEYLASTVESGSAVNLTSATAANITSVSLSAGDWDVDGVVYFVGTLTGGYSAVSLNTNSATISGSSGLFVESPTMPTSTSRATLIHPARRLSVSSATTIYLVAQINYSVGTATAFGQVRARRIR